MYLAMAEAWGARPVVMGFADTYTGLSQGVVDFVECPPQAMVSSKFTELRKVVSLTNHMVNWNPVIVSQSSFAQLPEDLQQIVIEEAVKAGDLVTKLKMEDDAKIKDTLTGMGIEVVTDIDRAAFQKASLPAYESFTDWTPGLTETVRSVLDS